MAHNVILATGSTDRYIRFWKVGNGEQMCSLPFQQEDSTNSQSKLFSQVNCLALSVDKRFLAVGGYGMLHVYDVTPIYTHHHHHPSSRRGPAQQAPGASVGTHVTPLAIMQHNPNTEANTTQSTNLGGAPSNHGGQPATTHALNITACGFFRYCVQIGALVSAPQQQGAPAAPSSGGPKQNVVDLIYTVAEDGFVKVWDFNTISSADHHGSAGHSSQPLMRLVGSVCIGNHPITCCSLLAHPSGSAAAAETATGSQAAVLVGAESLLFCGTQTGNIVAVSIHKLLKGLPQQHELLMQRSSSGGKRGPSLPPVLNVPNAVVFTIKTSKDSSAIRSLAFSPADTRLLVAVNDTGYVYCFRLAGGSGHTTFADALRQSFSSSETSSATPATKKKVTVASSPTNDNDNDGVDAKSDANAADTESQASTTHTHGAQHRPSSSLMAESKTAKSAASDWCDTPSYCALIWVFPAHSKYILRCAISRDGRLLATASADNTVRLWSVPPNLGQPPPPPSAEPQPQAPPPKTGVAALSKVDSTIVLSASGSASPTVKDAPAPLPSAPQQAYPTFGTEPWPLAKEVNGHGRWVWDCAFSNCSTYLVTASSDKTGRLWNIGKDPIRLTMAYNGHEKPVTCVVLNDVAEPK